MDKKITKKEEIALFERNEVRKVWYKDKWFFVVSDVVQILTDSKDVQGYIKDMRRRDKEISKGWGQIATPPYRRNKRRKTKNELC